MLASTLLVYHYLQDGDSHIHRLIVEAIRIAMDFHHAGRHAKQPIDSIWRRGSDMLNADWIRKIEVQYPVLFDLEY